MKILFIGSGCACRLPFVEYLFKKKIQEAEVPDIEVESADMAMWGVTSNESGIPESSGPDKVGNLLNQADYSHVLFTMRTVYQVDGQKYEEDRNEEQDYGKYRKEHAANSEKSG